MSDFTQLPGNALPNLYADGCTLSVTSNILATIATGQVRDSTNSFDIAVQTPLIVDFMASGANGIDTGVFTANSTYYIYVLYDDTNANNPASLASLSATQPLMPSLNGVTFSQFRMVGALLSDSNPFLIPVINVGTGNLRRFQWLTSISVLSAGSAAVATSIDLSGAMPSANYGRVQLATYFTPDVVGDIAFLNAHAVAGLSFVLTGIVATVTQGEFVEIQPLQDTTFPAIDYYVGSALDSLSINVTGFEMFI
jgi:hypothetical protein